MKWSLQGCSGDIISPVENDTLPEHLLRTYDVADTLRSVCQTLSVTLLGHSRAYRAGTEDLLKLVGLSKSCLPNKHFPFLSGIATVTVTLYAEIAKGQVKKLPKSLTLMITLTVS